MFLPLLLSVGLLAQSPADAAADRNAYQQAVARAGRDAAAHIKLALWCEAHGLDAERMKHLARAVLIDPKSAAARGMMGLVAYHGRWESPGTVSQKVQVDGALAANLAEYEARRAELRKEVGRFLDPKALAAKLAQFRNDGESAARYREEARREELALQHKKAAQAHVRVAIWCEKNELKPESSAHFAEAAQLYPALRTPWEHLGFKRHKGRWMREEQIAAEEREVEEQRHADRHWEPLLRTWRLWLGEKSRRNEAEAHLARVTDVRAVPSIWKVFVKGGVADQRQALRLLERINSPAATRAMVMLAVFNRADDLRDRSVEALHTRDPRDVIPPLIELIQPLLRYTLKPPSTTGGSKGTLIVEGEHYDIQRSYYGPSLIYNFSVPVGVVRSDLRDLIAREQLLDDVQEIKQINALIQQVNSRALPVLRVVAGQDISDDADLWRKWWVEQQGYVYDPPMVAEKTTYFRPFGHAACFAAGTLIATRSGLKRIESLQLGDCVLSQDTRTGTLSYQPVLAAHHNPPNQTLRIHTDGEVVVATGIHRFWKASRGWVMARDLKPGDSLRIIGGTARVDRLEPDTVQPVYNLDVAKDRNFFVGKSGLLVHDFSLVEAVPEPFDAVPSLDGE